jgi:hypothetical protein
MDRQIAVLAGVSAFVAVMTVGRVVSVSGQEAASPIGGIGPDELARFEAGLGAFTIEFLRSL